MSADYFFEKSINTEEFKAKVIEYGGEVIEPESKTDIAKFHAKSFRVRKGEMTSVWCLLTDDGSSIFLISRYSSNDPTWLLELLEQEYGITIEGGL